MAAGRCAGCGRTNSLRKICQHVLECQKYIELYAQNPGRALTPLAEYERHRRENTPEARAIQRGHRLHERFAEINRQQAATATRWQRPPDLLD